ncbi:MAG: SIS domain-containing protein [Bacillota bacterium]
MYNNIDKYVTEFQRTLERTEVQTGDGTSLEFNDGAELAIGIIQAQTSLGKKLIFIGNGGSAGIASHMAIDFWKNGGMRAVAFNDGALLTCIGNDYGYAHVFGKPIAMFAESGDILIAISSSGKSENILRGVESGRATGCKVITLSGFSCDNPLRRLGDLNFYVPVSHYGFVEVGHQMLLHAVLDIIIERKMVSSINSGKRRAGMAALSLDPTLSS